MVKCSLYERNHDLDDCKSFLQFDLRVSVCFITLFFGCLSAISVNHNATNCKDIKECKVCKKRNSTSLHGYKAEKSKVKQPDGNSSDESKINVNCATANTRSEVITMYVVPVPVPAHIHKRIYQLITEKLQR